MAMTGEGKGVQTGSLPSTPWVQVLLGVPSCPGHPVMETTIQGSHSYGVSLGGQVQRTVQMAFQRPNRGRDLPKVCRESLPGS